LGVEVASVLLVMCGWTPDTDRFGLQDSTVRGGSDKESHALR
jgi:hypothetical protein